MGIVIHNYPNKDPGATLDYALDLKALTHGLAGAKSDWLATGETISTYTVTADTGITVATPGESDGKITWWLSGGSLNKTYEIKVLWTTSAGRTDARTMRVNVERAV